MNTLIRKLRRKVIVSVQAYPGEPMREPSIMAAVASSVEYGGAAAIRCQGLADIAAIKGRVRVPVIGLWKEGNEGVYITPSMRHARACAMAGADIVAIDATARPRPDGSTVENIVQVLHDMDVLVMADCGSLDDACRAQDSGVDILSTTLGGYTPDRPKTDGPDFGLLSEISRELTTPVFCEGRIRNPSDVSRAFENGAWSVVIGTAITHPATITSWFVEAAQ